MESGGSTSLISIVMSLRNGSENVSELLGRISNTLNSSDYEYEIFLVTKDTEEKFLPKNLEEDRINLFRRKTNEGSSSAILRCIESIENEIIVVMDSSLHHKPEKIPELLSEIENGRDVAVGCQSQGKNKRYLRRFSIKILDILAKTLFRDIREIKDIKSGFFAFKKSVIQNSNINPVGYRILLEILVLGEYNEISEVRIKAKESNSKIIQIEHKLSNYLKHIINLTHRTGELLRIIKFSFVGGLAAIINLICLYLLTNFGQLHYLLSGLIAIEIGLVSSFFMNKSLTFKDRNLNGSKSLIKSLLRDHIVRSGGIIINMVILAILTKIGLFYMLSQMVGIWFAGVWNFSGNKWWTWE